MLVLPQETNLNPQFWVLIWPLASFLFGLICHLLVRGFWKACAIVLCASAMYCFAGAIGELRGLTPKLLAYSPGYVILVGGGLGWIPSLGAGVLVNRYLRWRALRYNRGQADDADRAERVQHADPDARGQL